MGVGVELFRLDAIDEEELTVEEAEIADEVKDEASTTAVMRIYEEIGEDFWTGGGVTAKRFSDELREFGDIKRLNIHINSLGGDAFAAQAIHSIISDHPSKKTSYIDGVAASAATIIACGADEVIARHNTNYMIHYPWAVAVGDAETLRKGAEDLEKITIPIVSVYKTQVKGKTTEAQIRQLMGDETWMTADEARDYGFVDRVRGKIKAIARASKTQIMCNGKLMDVGRYHYKNLPKYPSMRAEKPEFEPEADLAPKSNNKKGISMTREDIDPQLLASITEEARVAERARLAALDAMNGPGLSEVITKAKVDGKQPGEIAMECFTLTKAQLTAAEAVSALARDAKPANQIKAGDAPLGKPEEDRKTKGANLIANAFKAQRPQQRTVAGNGSN